MLARFLVGRWKCVIDPRGRDIRFLEDYLVIGGRVKGGRYRARSARPETRTALPDDLSSAGKVIYAQDRLI